MLESRLGSTIQKKDMTTGHDNCRVQPAKTADIVFDRRPRSHGDNFFNVGLNTGHRQTSTGGKKDGIGYGRARKLSP